MDDRPRRLQRATRDVCHLHLQRKSRQRVGRFLFFFFVCWCIHWLSPLEAVTWDKEPARFFFARCLNLVHRHVHDSAYPSLIEMVCGFRSYCCRGVSKAGDHAGSAPRDSRTGFAPTRAEQVAAPGFVSDPCSRRSLGVVTFNDQDFSGMAI